MMKSINRSERSHRWIQTASMTFLGTLLLAQPTAVHAEDGWGEIRGRIVFDGAVPEREPLEITRDEDVCGNLGLTDQSLVVDPKTHGVRYVGVWLESRQAVPVHPDLQAAPAEAPRLDNQGCLFVPHMLAVRTGQPVAFSNSDPVAHNAAVFARRNQPFSEVIPQSAPVQKVFQRPETQPIRVDCSIHAWMKAWIIITDHPYVGVSKEDGTFQISQLPAGKWTFRFWHERPGFLESMAENPGAQDDAAGNTKVQQPVRIQKGTLELEIRDGEVLDLGDIRVAAKQFADR